MPEDRLTTQGPSPAGLPTGTVTFVMTDIEGSTQLLHALGDAYPALLAQHDQLLEASFSAAGGVRVSSEGDGAFYAFPHPAEALRATVDAQRALAAHPWPSDARVRVRMGLHAGAGTLHGDTYVGLDVHRTARILSAAHGGQVIASESVRTLVHEALPAGTTLRDLGEHRLKDFEAPARLFQVEAPDLGTAFPPLRAEPMTKVVDLPRQLTDFVGRAREVPQVADLVALNRIVTLTGPGGTGKTRLSLAVAQMAADRFDAVHFVPLAAVTDPELVLPAIAMTVGVHEAKDGPLRDRLVEAIGDRAVLVVLDNLEQVVSAASVVADLVAATPRLHAFCTSRESLRIAGEQVFGVPPLPVPDIGSLGGLEDLRAIDSVALFVRRARAVRPAFDLTEANAAAVARTCARLDGLPLAIELAAARIGLFEPEEILARLDRRLGFLSGGRDAPERQRTLRGAIDWSYGLLEHDEQVVFRRLSVFAGGATLEAIEAVCRPQELGLDPIGVVTSLHDKSLLRRDDTTADDLRLTMLETIQDFAGEQLEASGEAAETRAAHARWFVALAERAAGPLSGAEQPRWLAALDRDLANLRAAIRRTSQTGDHATAIRIVAALTTYWLLRNHVREGRDHLDRLLDAADENVGPVVRAAAIRAAADLATWQGDYEVGLRLAEEVLPIYEELDDVAGLANVLGAMGWALIVRDPAESRRRFRQSLEAYRRAGSPPDTGGSLNGLALAELQRGDVDAATAHLHEGAAIFRAAGNESMTLVADGLLGLCDRRRGDLVAARRRALDVLDRAAAVGAHVGLTLPLTSLADLALIDGDVERAVVLEAAQLHLAEQLGGTPTSALAGIPSVLDRAQAQLHPDQFEAALSNGRSMSLDEALALARGDTSPAKG